MLTKDKLHSLFYLKSNAFMLFCEVQLNFFNASKVEILLAFPKKSFNTYQIMNQSECT